MKRQFIFFFLLLSFTGLNISCEKIDVTNISCSKFSTVSKSSNDLLNTPETVNIDDNNFKLDVLSGHRYNTNIRGFPGNLFPEVVNNCSYNVSGYVYKMENNVPVELKDYNVEKLWVINNKGQSWETSKIAIIQTPTDTDGIKSRFKIQESAPSIGGFSMIIKFNHNNKSYFIKSNIRLAFCC